MKTRVVDISEAAQAYLNNNAIPFQNNFEREEYSAVYGSRKEESYPLHIYPLKNGCTAKVVLDEQRMLNDGTFLILGLVIDDDYLFERSEEEIDEVIDRVLTKEQEDEEQELKHSEASELNEKLCDLINEALITAKKIKELGFEHSYDWKLTDLNFLTGLKIKVQFLDSKISTDQFIDTILGPGTTDKMRQDIKAAEEILNKSMV